MKFSGGDLDVGLSSLNYMEEEAEIVAKEVAY